MTKKDYLAVLYEVIERADIVLEVLDARFFEETRNIPAEEKVLNLGKKLIYVLNKIDLIELAVLKKKVVHLYPRVFISCTLRKGGADLLERILMVAKKLPYDKAFVGIMGYPNTGKSSVINLLSKRGAARASSESGFTKGIQKIRISSKITLIDTPGVIPESKHSYLPEDKELVKLGKIGVKMYDKVKNPELIVDTLFKQYRSVLEDYYHLSGVDSLGFLEHLARQRNYLLKGGVLDLNRAAREVLRDWQKGKIKVKGVK